MKGSDCPWRGKKFPRNGKREGRRLANGTKVIQVKKGLKERRVRASFEILLRQGRVREGPGPSRVRWRRRSGGRERAAPKRGLEKHTGLCSFEKAERSARRRKKILGGGGEADQNTESGGLWRERNLE